jgi:transposase
MAPPKGNKNALGNNGGRPSKYDPAYCAKVVKLGKQGKSLTQIAVALDVDKATLNNWADKHIEFFTSLTRAKQCEQAWWEDMGQKGLTADKFNSAVWAKSMSARFRDDYTERRELAGVPDRPIETKEVSSRRDLARAIAFALAQGLQDSHEE